MFCCDWPQVVIGLYSTLKPTNRLPGTYPSDEVQRAVLRLHARGLVPEQVGGLGVESSCGSAGKLQEHHYPNCTSTKPRSTLNQ